jgi:hypothetical protein
MRCLTAGGIFSDVRISLPNSRPLNGNALGENRKISRLIHKGDLLRSKLQYHYAFETPPATADDAGEDRWRLLRVA